MKRFLFTLLLLGFFVVFAGSGAELLSTLLRLDAPKSHEINPGDWLSKLALKHYGDVSYWRELALINRAPNADLIFPEEDLIIPSFDAIQKIRSTRSLAAVNEILDNQIAILAGDAQMTQQPAAGESTVQRSTPSTTEPRLDAEQTSPIAEPGAPEEPDEFAMTDGTSTDEAESSFFTSTLGLTIIAVAIVIMLVGFIMYRRNKKREEDEDDDLEQGRDKRQRGLFEFDHEADTQDAEQRKDRGKNSREEEKHVQV